MGVELTKIGAGWSDAVTEQARKVIHTWRTALSTPVTPKAAVARAPVAGSKCVPRSAGIVPIH